MSFNQRGRLRDRLLRRDKEGYKKNLRTSVGKLKTDNDMQSCDTLQPKEKTVYKNSDLNNIRTVAPSATSIIKPAPENEIKKDDTKKSISDVACIDSNNQDIKPDKGSEQNRVPLLRFGVPDVLDDIPSINSVVESPKSEKTDIIDVSPNIELIHEQRDIILKKIKNKLKKDLNELDVIESEIFLLNGCKTDSGVSKIVEENRKKLLSLIKKAQKIKKQFCIFKENSYLEDIIWLDDSNLVDDISRYKSMVVSTKELEDVKDDLELCDEYKSLLLEIEKVEEENRILDLKSRERLLFLQQKDHEYDAYQKYSDSFLDVANQMNHFLKKQDEAMEKFQSQVGVITSEDVVNYQMKNLDKLLYFNAKYFFGLLLSPFRGLFPSLAYNAFATKKMIDNISKTVHLEEIRSTVYHATDYSKELDYTLYSLNDVGSTLDENINRLSSLEVDIKTKFNGYDAYKLDRILKKIEKMKKILDNNRYKLEKVKEVCYGHIKENERVLKKVKTLNDN